MSALLRYTPFKKYGLVDTFDLADRLLNQLSLASPSNGEYHRGFNVDIVDKGTHYVVEAEIPGAQKENISVSVHQNQITIAAELKKETEKKEGETVLWSERYTGKVSRSFTLDQPIDDTQTKASYADGILKLELPKKVASSIKQITID
jgi:HSP20 family protein